GRLGGDDVAALEEERSAHALAHHHELALPARLADERDHVADRAGRRDLPGETEDGASARVALAVLADLPHHDEVLRRRQNADRPLPSAHFSARGPSYGVRCSGRVDAHELEPLVVHSAARYSLLSGGRNVRGKVPP